MFKKKLKSKINQGVVLDRSPELRLIIFDITFIICSSAVALTGICNLYHMNQKSILIIKQVGNKIQSQSQGGVFNLFKGQKGKSVD